MPIDKLNKNIKICHVTSVHSRYDVRIYHKECRSLAINGYDVALVVNDDLEDEFIDGVQIISTRFKPKNRIDRILNTRKKIYAKMLELDCNIYHFHDPELLPIGVKLIKHGKKAIYDSHEDVPRQILAKHWIPKLARKPISYVYEKYENYVAHMLTGIVTPTPKIFERFKLLNKNTVQISNYPLMSEFTKPANWELRKPLGCYIGGISENRGIVQMIQAVELSGIGLNLCGKFESSDIKDSIIKSSDLIQYRGFLDRNSIKDVLDESMFGLVTLLDTPNHVNSYPIKMFEYMAAGVPVVASNFPLWKEIIQQNKCGVCVDPTDAKELSEAIKYIVTNQKQAKLMGENGRKAIVQQFNWNTQEKVLLRLYGSI